MTKIKGITKTVQISKAYGEFEYKKIEFSEKNFQALVGKLKKQYGDKCVVTVLD